MRFRLSLLIIFISLLSICILAQAQKVGSGHADKKHVADSAQIARERVQDSVSTIREHIKDSTRTALLHFNDSVKNYHDSLNTVRAHILDSTNAARKLNSEKMKEARANALDSMKDARQHFIDSTKSARQSITDSMKLVRKHVTDSLNAIHKYRDSKHFKDSIANRRQQHIDSLQAVRKVYFDSLKAARQKVTDSVLAVRKARLEEQKAKQKKRADSLAAIRKYRESKRYRDSVAVFRQERMDSLREAREHFNDSLTKIRKHRADSMMIARKLSLDSANLVRKLHSDSIKAVRKIRTDSLAKIKSNREKQLKSKEEANAKKQQLALELKINKKRQAWSNQKMLKKKWSVPRQVVQNTFTRYNYYYNSDKKMDEALANMQRIRKDNYDSVIGLYPYDPNRDSTVLLADMDTIIHKVSVGIQIHDPRSKWDDDLYLLLGQAYYYKGSYDNAATAFHYIISIDERNKKKNKTPTTYHVASKQQPSIVENDKKTMLDFLKHKPVHNEAILWMSRTYTEAHHTERAEAVLALLEGDSSLPQNLKGRLALEKAFISLTDHNYKTATQQLGIAEKDNNLPGWLRERAAFLNGQLLQTQGNYTASVASFKQVLDLNPKIDMDFYARKYLAYSSILAGGDKKDAVAALKSVLNDGKYTTYYDQIYFILGQLAVSSNNSSEAVAYFKKSTSTLRGSKKQKAITFSVLGNLYYNTGNYLDAKAAYDSSAKFVASAPNDTLVQLAVHRSMVLDKIVSPLEAIHNQDSLLELASLSDKEQRAVVRRYIRSLERLRSDSIYNAEHVGINSIVQAEPVNNGEDNSATTWYFANSTLMQQGFNDFKRRWGNRPLVDNWQRMSAVNAALNSASVSNTNTSGANGQTPGIENKNVDENGLPTEEGLLAAIPNTPAQKEKANALIQKAYINLANAYVRELEDYTRATSTLDTFDKRFSNHGQRDEELYLRYIMALRQQQLEKAQGFSQQLLQQFPNSEYATLVRPSESGSGLTASVGEKVSNYYDETYSLLLQRQYNDVLLRINQAEKQYKDQEYQSRFIILKAMALAGSGSYGKADTMLTDFTKTNPSDSLRGWAETILKYINKIKPAGGASVTQAGTSATSTGATANTTTADNSAVKASTAFDYNPKEPHFCVIVLPGMEQRASGVKAAVGDFNTFKFSSLGLISNMDLLTPKQVLIVTKQFQSAAQAKIYMNSLKGTAQIFREYKSIEYQIFIISSNNYGKLFTNRTIQPYLTFYNEHYK